MFMKAKEACTSTLLSHFSIKEVRYSRFLSQPHQPGAPSITKETSMECEVVGNTALSGDFSSYHMNRTAPFRLREGARLLRDLFFVSLRLPIKFC